MEDKRVEEVIRAVLSRLESCEELAVTAEPSGYLLRAEDLLTDLKIFADEVFDGEAVEDGNAVEVRFRNGQIFRIGVEEKFV